MKLHNSCVVSALLLTGLSFSSITNAAFISRLGGLAFYDDQTNLTWAANANINSFEILYYQEVWAAGLDIGGVTGWRLPSADVNGDGIVVDCTGGGVTNCIDNEMGFLFWEQGISSDSPGPFSNILSNTYWTTTKVNDLPKAWSFHFGLGVMFPDSTSLWSNYAWAVQSGDVAAVPLPAGVWLFGSGLLGLFGIAMRKSKISDDQKRD